MLLLDRRDVGEDLLGTLLVPLGDVRGEVGAARVHGEVVVLLILLLVVLVVLILIVFILLLVVLVGPVPGVGTHEARRPAVPLVLLAVVVVVGREFLAGLLEELLVDEGESRYRYHRLERILPGHERGEAHGLRGRPGEHRHGPG